MNNKWIPSTWQKIAMKLPKWLGGMSFPARAVIVHKRANEDGPRTSFDKARREIEKDGRERYIIKNEGFYSMPVDYEYLFSVGKQDVVWFVSPKKGVYIPSKPQIKEDDLLEFDPQSGSYDRWLALQTKEIEAAWEKPDKAWWENKGFMFGIGMFIFFLGLGIPVYLTVGEVQSITATLKNIVASVS